MLKLADQLVGAAQGIFSAADPCGLDKDFADQKLWLGSRRILAGQGGLDLVVTDPQARAIAAVDPALPANFSADLRAQGFGIDPGGGEGADQLLGGGAVFLRHAADLAIDILVLGNDRELLFLLDPAQFLHL